MDATTAIAAGSVAIRPIAEPDSAQARILRRRFDLELLDSLSYATEQAGHGLGRPVETPLALLASVRTRCQEDGRSLRAVAFTIHTELTHALREGDGVRVNALVDRLATIPLVAEATSVVAPGMMDADEEALLYATFGRENQREYGQRFDARPPDRVHHFRAVEAVNRAFQVLADEDAQTAGEVEALVSDVVVMGSDSVNAGTSSRAFGYVLLRELGADRQWTTYLESIVHETSHLYLYTLFLVDPIIQEDGRRDYPSPIRPGGRPLSAVMHAAFVLARTARIVRVIGSRAAFRHDIEAMSTSYNAAANPETFESKFMDAWQTLRSEANFTPFGQELLADCRRIAIGKN